MARGRKSSLRIVLSSEEQATLERWQRSTTVAAGLVRRGKILTFPFHVFNLCLRRLRLRIP